MRLQNGNVGIGKSSSITDRLHIEKSGANCLLSVARTDGAAGRLVMQHTSSAGALQTTGSVPLTFGTADTERMRITNTSVGIGVVPETFNAVEGAVQVGTRQTLTSFSNDVGIGYNHYYNSGWKYTNADVARRFSSTSTAPFIWQYAASGSADAAITWLEAMRIDVNGNCLVGVTSAALAANQGIQAAGPIESGHSIRQESNSIATSLGNDGGSGSFGTATNHALNISSNNTTRLQLAADGVLGIFNGRNNVGILSGKTAVSLADDASVNIFVSGSNTAGRGILCIYETSNGGGCVASAGYAGVSILHETSPSGDFVVGDTDGKLCIINSAHGLSFKNRIGAAKTFNITWMGAAGT
jgi:hypothetical protein